ncbi:hypothetical protein D3C86_1642550 [compost metagenome]
MGFEIGLCLQDRFLYTSAEIDMVIFKHYHVVQAIAMVMSAADQYCLLFLHPEQWCGLTGIENTGRIIFDLVYIALGHAGNTTHALHGVQHQALCLKNGVYTGFYFKSNISVTDGITIFQKKIKAGLRLQVMKNILSPFHTGQDTIFFYFQYSLTPCFFGNAGQC